MEQRRRAQHAARQNIFSPEDTMLAVLLAGKKLYLDLPHTVIEKDILNEIGLGAQRIAGAGVKKELGPGGEFAGAVGSSSAIGDRTPIPLGGVDRGGAGGEVVVKKYVGVVGDSVLFAGRIG